MIIGFFIQFRLKGYAEEYARWVHTRINREAKRLKIRRLKHKFKPHISLFGPARTDNLKGVIRSVEKTCNKHTLVPFEMGGFDQFRNPDAYWLFLKAYPSAELEQLRYDLAQSLLGSESVIRHTCEQYDHRPEYRFHCSIIKCAPRDKEKFDKLVQYAEAKCSLEIFRQRETSALVRLVSIIKRHMFGSPEADPRVNLHLLRIRVSGRGKREYDLVLKRFLTGRDVWSRYWRRRSVEALKAELAPPREQELHISDSAKCYFIGDTHFDHKNIIRYCHRPFSGVAEMNRAMKDKWNNAVGQSDTVFFLGDYTGPPRRLGVYYERLKYWTRQLEGAKTSILGNHDRRGGCIAFEKTMILRVAHGRSFLLIHDPTDDIPNSIRAKYDWIIHGHVHNNRLGMYPFINGEQKTINVSAELIDYRPVSLSHLLSLDLDSVKRMETINHEPERW